MIHAHGISLHFNEQPIFNDASFIINNGQKVGTVGRNGAGKSTLLRVLTGSQSLDSGTITTAKNTTLAYLPQELTFTSPDSVFTETMKAFDEFTQLSARARTIEHSLEDHSVDHAALLDEYHEIQTRLIEFNPNNLEARVISILSGLGFDTTMRDAPVNNLSMGWRMRVVLAKLLLKNATFYLFDEPTNHLDIVAQEWFAQFLRNSSSGFLLVTHDKYLLDSVCDHILEIDHGNIYFFSGNYEHFLSDKKQRRERHEQQFAQQQKEIAQKIKTAERFRAKSSKAKMAQNIFKQVERMEKVAPPSTDRATIAFPLGTVTRSGSVVLSVDNLSAGYNDKKVFENLSFDIHRGEKVAIVAANGKGKSTLFNAITTRIPSTGAITLGHNVTCAFFEQEQDKVLTPHHTVLDEALSGAPSLEARGRVRSLLGAFLFSGEAVDKKVHMLSGGERNRLAMVKVLLQNANFLLLDEPTNHLDLPSKDRLCAALAQYGGTILFVAHDHDVLSRIATRILELHPDRILSYPGTYEEYCYAKQHERSPLQPSSHEDKTPTLRKQPASTRGKEQRKEIRRLEQKIDLLEKQLAKQSTHLENASFGTPQYNKLLNSIAATKEKLDKLLEKWEKLNE